MGYSVKIAKSAMKDLKNLKSAHLDQKFIGLMEILKVNPSQNPLPYEKLVGNLNDKYSRRLNMLNCNIKCIKNFKNLYRQRITQ